MKLEGSREALAEKLRLEFTAFRERHMIPLHFRSLKRFARTKPCGLTEAGALAAMQPEITRL